MQVIETIEVGSGGAASITFTSIPQTFTDLYLVVSGRNSSDQYFYIKPNGSSSDLSSRQLRGNGSVASSSAPTSILTSDGYTGFTSNTFGSSATYIPNYTSSNPKSMSIDSVSENNGTTASQRLSASLWDNTAAITSLELDSVGTFQQYSSATLYGITAGSDGTTTVS